MNLNKLLLTNTVSLSLSLHSIPLCSDNKFLYAHIKVVSLENSQYCLWWFRVSLHSAKQRTKHFTKWNKFVVMRHSRVYVFLFFFLKWFYVIWSHIYMTNALNVELEKRKSRKKHKWNAKCIYYKRMKIQTANIL